MYNVFHNTCIYSNPHDMTEILLKVALNSTTLCIYSEIFIDTTPNKSEPVHIEHLFDSCAKYNSVFRTGTGVYSRQKFWYQRGRFRLDKSHTLNFKYVGVLYVYLPNIDTLREAIYVYKCNTQ